MKNLIAVPLLALILVLQTAIVSRITLLSGSVDLMLLVIVSWSLQHQVETALHWALLGGLMVALVSGLPPYDFLAGFLVVALMARFVQSLVWQTPVLALFSVTFLGTLLTHLLSFFALRLNGSPIQFGDALALITLPSLFLNLLVVLPVYSLIRDLALWVYPMEEFA